MRLTKKEAEITKAWPLLVGKMVEVNYGFYYFKGIAQSWSGLYLTLEETKVRHTKKEDWAPWKNFSERFTSTQIKGIKLAN